MMRMSENHCILGQYINVLSLVLYIGLLRNHQNQVLSVSYFATHTNASIILPFLLSTGMCFYAHFRHRTFRQEMKPGIEKHMGVFRWIRVILDNTGVICYMLRVNNIEYEYEIIIFLQASLRNLTTIIVQGC